MFSKPKSIPTGEAIKKIAKAIHDLDMTLFEMMIQVKEKNAGFERLNKYEDAVNETQTMYRALINIVFEYEKLSYKYVEVQATNQDLLREIEKLKKIDAL